MIILYIALAIFVLFGAFQILLGLLELAYAALLLLFAGILEVIMVIGDIWYFAWKAASGKK